MSVVPCCVLRDRSHGVVHLAAMPAVAQRAS